MNRQKTILLVVGLLMMAGTAGLLARMKTHQQLGEPGVKTRPLPDSKNLEVLLPAFVLDYTSEKLEQASNVVSYLPADTSYGQRRYKATDGFTSLANVVLMGADRTSIHKPQFCLEGGGWRIDAAASGVETIKISHPFEYNLPVMKLVTSKQFKNEDTGQLETWRGIYVYWFVADDALTASHGERMWWMAKELLTTGKLQRWAYISFFSVCPPGHEDACFARMQELISAAVPEFQLTPSGSPESVAAVK